MQKTSVKDMQVVAVGFLAIVHWNGEASCVLGRINASGNLRQLVTLSVTLYIRKIYLFCIVSRKHLCSNKLMALSWVTCSWKKKFYMPKHIVKVEEMYIKMWVIKAVQYFIIHQNHNQPLIIFSPKSLTAFT